MPITAQDIMTRRVETVRPEMTLADLERRLLDDGISGAPVVDSSERVVGVISRSDVLRQLVVGQTLAQHMLTDYYRDVSGFHNLGVDELSPDERDREEKTIGGRLMDYRVSDAMVDNVLAVSPETPVERVAQQMIEHGIHRILVTRDGRLLGLVTSMDIVRRVAYGDGPPAPRTPHTK